jgi:hypothetical protein
LSQLPSEAHALCQMWLDVYANADPLSGDQLYSLVERARMHQDLLKQTIASA